MCLEWLSPPTEPPTRRSEAAITENSLENSRREKESRESSRNWPRTLPCVDTLLPNFSPIMYLVGGKQRRAKVYNLLL